MPKLGDESLACPKLTLIVNLSIARGGGRGSTLNVHQNVARIVVSTVLLISLAPATAFAAFDPTAAVGALDPSPYINPDGSLKLVEGLSGTLDLTGWEVDLDSQRGLVFQPAVAIDGAWSPLHDVGTGLTGSGEAIVLDGGAIYVGGFFFDAAGDPDIDNIATVNSGAWASLGGAGTGLNNVVRAVAVDGGVIYAGGTFTDAGGDSDADNIAKFESGAWSSLGGAGTGLNSGVLTITIDGGIIYAGGNFTNAGGDADADRIAQFSGGSWSSLGAGGGLNSRVETIAVDGGIIYAGGGFLNAGGDLDADFIAKFESGAWSSLGGAGTGLSSTVLDILISGSVIYAVGEFQNAGGDTDADYIAKFSGGAWSSLAGAGSGLPDYASVLLISDGIFYAGGAFENAGGDPNADRIAKFSDGAWSSLNGANTGLSDTVEDMAIVDNVLYAAGAFENAGGNADADYAAQFGLVFSTSSSGAQATASKDIATTGTTTLQMGRVRVSVPASAIPNSETNCRIMITRKGDSGDYGFELDDQVWDVKVMCDSGEVSLLFAPISICIRPQDGVTTNKQVFHNHGGGFIALASSGALSGYVCGQTQSLSLFTLGGFGLPATGFALGAMTQLGEQPAELAYSATDITLNIPTLNLRLDVVGVPQGPNGWDVSWLSADAGWLHGTAFPTLAGNSVLTAHVWNADNTPGPFAHLDQLQYGDRFNISAWGQTFTYEVRSNSLVSPNSVRPLAHEDYDWVTLITCQSFDESTGEYALRRAVRAVLVSVD